MPAGGRTRRRVRRGPRRAPGSRGGSGRHRDRPVRIARARRRDRAQTRASGYRCAQVTAGHGAPVPAGADAMMLGVRRLALSSRQTWWALFALFLLGCLAWTVATPLMATPDEGAHAVRAAGVARGQLLPERKRFVIEAWMQRVPEAYGKSGSAACFGRPLFANEDPHKIVTPACVPRFHGTDRLVTVPTYEFRASPAYYWLTGLPSLIWPDRPGMFGMRILNGLAFSALVASAFASALARRRRSWAVAGVA